MKKKIIGLMILISILFSIYPFHAEDVCETEMDFNETSYDDKCNPEETTETEEYYFINEKSTEKQDEEIFLNEISEKEQNGDFLIESNLDLGQFDELFLDETNDIEEELLLTGSQDEEGALYSIESLEEDEINLSSLERQDGVGEEDVLFDTVLGEDEVREGLVLEEESLENETEDTIKKKDSLERATEEILVDSEGTSDKDFHADKVDEMSLAKGYCGENLLWDVYKNGMLSISGKGFMDDYSLETSAPWKEFADDITQVILSENVKSISKYAFNGMTSLENVYISEDVCLIDVGAFRDCKNLRFIEVDSQNPYFIADQGIIYTSNYESLLIYPPNIYNTTFIVPEQVKTISEYAFYGQKYLENILLSSLELQIGDNAFAECISLSNIAMNN